MPRIVSAVCVALSAIPAPVENVADETAAINPDSGVAAAAATETENTTEDN